MKYRFKLTEIILFIFTVLAVTGCVKHEVNIFPPEVKTKAVTNITENSATLNGSVIAYGVATKVSFLYIKDSLTGDRRTIEANPSPVSNSVWADVSANITGLSAGTTYLYRIYAVCFAPVSGETEAFATNHPIFFFLKKSIAVLPFKNNSPNDSTTYFIDGVMEEMLTNLQTVKSLRVISRTSVEKYRNQTKSIPEIAKELGVNYIVEGSGQKSGNRFRLRLQLIRADKEGHLWAKSYEQENPEAKDYFSMQSQIAQTIASQLEAAITPQEKQLIEKTRTLNLEAYDAYLKGEFYRKRETKNDLDTALRYYNIALDKDPDYALVYCGIAYIYFEYLEMGYLSPSDGLPKEYAAIMTAQKLDSSLAEVHLGLGMYKVYSEWDWEGGESEYKKAIRINPNNAEAPAYYSVLLGRLGRSGRSNETDRVGT